MTGYLSHKLYTFKNFFHKKGKLPITLGSGFLCIVIMYLINIVITYIAFLSPSSIIRGWSLGTGLQLPASCWNYQKRWCVRGCPPGRNDKRWVMEWWAFPCGHFSWLSFQKPLPKKVCCCGVRGKLPLTEMLIFRTSTPGEHPGPGILTFRLESS